MTMHVRIRIVQHNYFMLLRIIISALDLTCVRPFVVLVFPYDLVVGRRKMNISIVCLLIFI